MPLIDIQAITLGTDGVANTSPSHVGKADRHGKPPSRPSWRRRLRKARDYDHLMDRGLPSRDGFSFYGRIVTSRIFPRALQPVSDAGLLARSPYIQPSFESSPPKRSCFD
jgi:hypothetical protein